MDLFVVSSYILVLSSVIFFLLVGFFWRGVWLIIYVEVAKCLNRKLI